MSKGVLLVVLIPALLAFVFGGWVLYSMLEDVSQREDLSSGLVGPDVIRIPIKPAT